MFRLLGALAGAAVLVCCGIVLLVVIILAPVAGMQGTCASSTSACMPGQDANAIVAAAELLQDHVYGVRANLYHQDDPVIQKVSSYWVQSCGSHGVICPEATSGNLQCVEFVTGAMFLADDPLHAVANAADLWPLYANRTGWTEIDATEYPAGQRGLPAPGDLMVWKGGEFGHVAIVINVVLPDAEHDGSVTVAQGNAPGNRWDPAHGGDPGNWYTMAIHPDKSIQTWPGYLVRGYIRQANMPSGLPSSPYVPLAWQDAQAAGFNPTTFVRQINQESGFNPNALSPAGAEGIAQFLPSTAASLGINPWDPVASLQAAAQVMGGYHHRYGGDDAKALAAYNAGSGAVDAAVSRCGSTWLSCMPTETQHYVAAILGP